MAITATERSQIVELTVMLFNAAPGAEYLSQIVSVYESTGRSLQTLANVLADTPVYQSLYPNTQTADQFADAFLTPLGLQNDALARDFVIAKHNQGVSKGQIVYDAYAALNTVPDTANNQYSAANAILNNKVAVAIYYSVDRAVDATDLASLQGALSGVTADPATVERAKDAIDATIDFTITAAASVNEGSSITVTIANGQPNTEYVVRVDSAHSSDVGSQLTLVTTDANGAATATIAVNADRTTEGAETMTISIVGETPTATVTINDTSLDNTAPAIAAAATLAADEDTAATFALSATDAEGDAVTVTTAAANGTLVNNGDGTYTYTPNANFSGSDTITVTAVDALGATSTQTIAVTVAALNDAATATVPATLAATEDTAASFTVTTADVEGDTVTVTATAANGTVVDNGDGTFSYTGNADFNGADTITVTATDQWGAATSQTIAVTVAAVNDAPVAVDEAVTTAEDTAVTIDVLANDTDADADTLTIKADSLVVADPTLGTAAIVDGQIVFTPAANMSGTTTISYVTTDGTVDSAAGTVTVTVTAVNDAPTVATVETASIEASDGGANNQQLTATATLADPESNFNGGSVTVSIGAHVLSGALSFAGTNFVLAGSSIIADGNGGTPVIEGGSDAIIGTVAYSGTTDLDTTGGTLTGYNTITITFNSDLVTAATVQQLLRDIRLDDPQVAGAGASADTAATVTVTVADAAGATAVFSRVMDATGALALTNLDDDAAEVQVANAAGYVLDVTANADLDFAGAQVSGTTITVASSVAGDAIYLENTSGAGVDNQARVVGNSVVYDQGATEVIIGTITGNGTSSVTITLNSMASVGAGTEGDIETAINNLLQGLTADFDTAVLGTRTITTTVASGDGFETDSNESVIALIGDFSEATIEGTGAAGGDSAGNALLWSDIDTAIGAGNVVTLTGNTYIELDDAAPTTDITAAIAAGDVVVPAGLVIRLVSSTGVAADLTGVTGLNDLGTISFGTTAEPLTEDLTITAAQADGRNGVVADNTSDDAATTITIADVQDTLDVDLTGFATVRGTSDGAGGDAEAVVATATLTEPVTFTGQLGDVALNVTGAFPLTVSATTADGATINAVDDIIVTGVNSSFDGDISGLTAAAVVVQFAENTTLNPAAVIASANLAATVAQNMTLTLTTQQAEDLATAGGTITGDDATGTGNTGGSIVVAVTDEDAVTAGTQVSNLDLSALTAGGRAVGSVSATAGSLTMTITGNTTFTGTYNDGSATVTVAAGVTVTGSAATLSGASMTGAGNVAITALNATAAADLSGIDVTGTKTANSAGNVTFTGNLGDFVVSVDENTTFITTAAIASGKTIAGDATSNDGGADVGGSVVITALGATEADLSGISAGAATDAGEGDTAGTAIVEAGAGAGVTLAAGTNLGSLTVNITDGDDTGAEAVSVTMTAAQATGRAIVDVADSNGTAADAGSLTVTGLTASTNLTNVDIAGSLTVNMTDASTVDISANANFGTGAWTLGGAATINLVDSSLTLTANQAHNVTIASADGADDDGAAGPGGEVDESSVTILSVTGDLDALGLTLNGSAGNDVIGDSEDGDTISAGDGNDTVSAADGDDNIDGGAGADSLSGGAGDDTITGGTDRDVMTGGDGDDTFVFVAGDSGVGSSLRDLITDFTDAGLAGGDVIDVSGILGADFIGTAAFSGVAGEVRYTVVSGNAVIEIDTDGLGGADMQIQLTGVDTLTDSDFVLV